MNPSALAPGGQEDWKPGSEGRLLSRDETEAYSAAVKKLTTFFEGSDLVWMNQPNGNGIYVISHLEQPRIECVLVNGIMCLKLYDVAEVAGPVSEVSAMWLGPLPLTSVMRKAYV